MMINFIAKDLNIFILIALLQFPVNTLTANCEITHRWHPLPGYPNCKLFCIPSYKKINSSFVLASFLKIAVVVNVLKFALVNDNFT